MTSAVTGTSNTLNPSVTSSNSIDVAGIVSQLMTVANQPLTTLQNKLTDQNTIISDLGQLKSNISTLQKSLTDLQTSSLFNTVSASSNSPSIVSATASNGAPIGRYNLQVNQTAEAANISVTGFTNRSERLALDVNKNLSASGGFNITIGSGESAVTYNSATTYTSTSVPISTTGATLNALDSSTATLTDLNKWINSLYSDFGANIGSSIVQTSAGNYALSISSTQTGIANAISFSGLNGGSVTTSFSTATTSSNTVNGTSLGNTAYTINVNTSARDALLNVNGLQVQRTTNTISDVVNNLTFNLLTPVLPGGSQTALVTVGAGADNSSTIINQFISSYNAVISQYKAMTANSVNSSSTTPSGSFSNDPGMLSFVQSIKQQVATGFYTATNTLKSMTDLGMDLQIDGTLKFNQTNFTSSQSNGLLATLAAGISVGGQVGNNLASSLANVVNPGGTIEGAVNQEKNSILYTSQKISDLKTQLNLLQTNYITQYSNLNTLLYQLSQTSSQLTSSLSAVTNINAGK
jgi:flagellar hook-associated protein 2